jgi:acylphosphatase
MKKTVLLTIQGHVQGVGFRYFVKLKADVLGIQGFVQNRSNGIVYVEAEGDEDQLNLFNTICEQGPYHARVEKIDIQYCTLQQFEGFQIK